jgi:hypothetical protein
MYDGWKIIVGIFWESQPFLFVRCGKRQFLLRIKIDTPEIQKMAVKKWLSQSIHGSGTHGHVE